MNLGKKLCEGLRKVRVKIAELNGIKYSPKECNHEGDCEGTCPVCEIEAAYLEQKLKELEQEGVEVKRTLEDTEVDEIFREAKKVEPKPAEIIKTKPGFMMRTMGLVLPGAVSMSIDDDFEKHETPLMGSGVPQELRKDEDDDKDEA